MPPRRINKPGGAGIILGNACCLCQRPADDTAPGGLGALIQCTSGNTTPKYHEACAAYSGVIALKRPKPGAIPEWLVSTEAARGSNVFCVLCRRPGAVIKCCGKGCLRSYHFPCAREAAMKVNPNLRIDESLRPVFAAVGTIKLACSQHAGDSIKNPLEEPAGIWFQNCGGWNCHYPEASTVLVSGGSLLENGETTADVGKKQGSSDQTKEGEEELAEHLGSTDAVIAVAAQERPEKAPASVKKGATFDIPNHIWEVSACVQGPLPPLRPKEGRVLGVTLSAPVFAAYRRTVSAFLIAAKRNNKLRHVVTLQNTYSTMPKKALNEINKSVQKTICNAAKVESIKKVPLDLPVNAPCHSSLGAFCISKDDPRAGLAAEPGALGVRVLSNAESIKPYELLGIYGGLQMYSEDHSRMLEDSQLAKAIGLRCKQQLATKIESYTADEEQMQNVDHFQEAIPEAFFVEKTTGGWYKNKASWLCTQAFLYGNLTCLINDPTLDPFISATNRHADDTSPEKHYKSKTNGKRMFNQNDDQDGAGSNSLFAKNLLAEPNCKMMSCLIRGWPYIILVSTAEIKPGQELLYLYNGKDNWQEHEHLTMDGYWSTLRDRIALENDALKALDREEELLKKVEVLEKVRLDQERKDQEIAALRAQLLVAKETFSSGCQDLGSNENGTGTFTAGGGGSAVIGTARRNAGSAAAAAAGTNNNGVTTNICAGAGDRIGVSVLTGSVSTEDLNISDADEEELQATAGTEDHGCGSPRRHLARLHSLVIGNDGSSGMEILREERVPQEVLISAGKFAAVPEPVVIDLTKDDDDDEDGGPAAAVAAAPAPAIAPLPSSQAKKPLEKKRSTGNKHPRSRSRRSRSRSRSRSRDCHPKRRSDGRDWQYHDRSTEKYKPSPVKSPHLRRGRDRGKGRGNFSYRDDPNSDSRDYRNDRRGRGGTHYVRRHSHSPDLRDMLHRSSSLDYDRINHRYRSRSRSRSRERSRDGDVGRDRSADRDDSREDRHRNHSHRSRDDHDSAKKKEASKSDQRKKDLPPLAPKPAAIAATIAATARPSSAGPPQTNQKMAFIIPGSITDISKAAAGPNSGTPRRKGRPIQQQRQQKNKKDLHTADSNK